MMDGCKVSFGGSTRSLDGSILLVVIVAIAAFSVAAYSYSHLMVTELSVAKAKNQMSQQRLLADSAIEQLLATQSSDLAKLTRGEFAGGKDLDFSNRAGAAVGALSLRGSSNLDGTYVLLRSMPEKDSPFRFGLNDESAKLNLNALASGNSQKQVVSKLMQYKNLRESIAQGIADLLGVETESSRAGNTTASSGTPYGIINSFDQLLTVSGVTEELLYGEDWNSNGILDPNENDGNLSSPPDNGDGRLDTGWAAEWTLTGAESNFRKDGRLKINLNQDSLVELYDQLLEIATPEQARFVTAWRMTSATYIDETTEPDIDSLQEELQEDRRRTFDERLNSQLGNSTDGAASGSEAISLEAEQSSVRNGLDLRRSGSRKFKSLLDLASCQLQVIIDGKDTVLVSPFANDVSSLAKWLAKWESNTTVSEGPLLLGRINILQASERTLQTIKGVTPQMARAIVTLRAGLTFSGESQEELTVGWLLEAGLLTSAELRKMASEITVSGSVFNGFVLGQLSKSRTASITYVELDGRSGELRLRRSLDLGTFNHSHRVLFED